MKTIAILVLASVCFIAEGQVETPSPSPAGSVSTVVGLTDIKIEYSRPRIRGRKIFGSEENVLLPYGRIWRTGANNGTIISFSDDVKVEGIDVPKGDYLIFTWPGATEWTIALYSDVSLGGDTQHYDKTKEVANFKVKPHKLTEKVDTFTISIGDLSDDSKTAKIELAWENTSVKFAVEVDYDTKVMQSINTYTQVNPNNYFQAAVYYLENGKDLNQALTWINKAAEATPDAFWVLYQKARIQKSLGDKAGARVTAMASLEKAKKADNRDYQKMNEELIASLN
jgi:tetratricopeptide (TPR) repeat protein